MLDDTEKEELLADGFSLARRKEFRSAERQVSEWSKKRQNRGCSIDEYLDILEKFQGVFVRGNLSPCGRQATVSRDIYRL
ncbi:MAG: hypothetical protein ACKVE3_05540 [Dissulfuribacterales bacterium]